MIQISRRLSVICLSLPGMAMAGQVCQGSSGSIATGSGAFACGMSATASGDEALAVGIRNASSGDYAVAIGYQSSSGGNFGVAVGPFAQAAAENGTAVGRSSRSNGGGAAAFGAESRTFNNQATAIGYGSEAHGFSSTALGYASHAQTSESLAIGSNSTALGSASNAFGVNSSAEAPFSVAIGRLAKVAPDALRSVALGDDSLAHRPNTVSVGGYGYLRQIAAVDAGTEGTDAVNLSQLLAHVQASAGKTLTAADTAAAIRDRELYAELKAYIDAQLELLRESRVTAPASK